MTTQSQPPKAPIGPRAKPGIWQIKTYVGGASKIEGANRVFKLSSNETPLGPSSKALAAYQGAGDKLEMYPEGGARELKAAIGEVHGLPPAQIIVGAGSDEILALLAHAYLGPGDEAVCTDHSFLIYRIATLTNNAIPVFAPEPDERADVDALLARVGPRTKVVFLANPSNPLGTYLTAAELERLHRGLPEDVLLVIDAAYAEYVTAADYSDGAELVARAPNVVMTRTLSKIYGLAGLRLGWAFVPPGVAEVYDRIRGPFNTSTPAQAAGIAALRDRDHMLKARDHNTLWRSRLSDEVAVLGVRVVPSAANFILLDFRGLGADAADAANLALQKGGVIVRHMKDYGLPWALRVSVGSGEANEVFLDLLKQWVRDRKSK